MKKGMRSNADGVLEKKRRSQKWKRLAGVLGCLVVIVTAYVLIRPAETLERELICGTEEHQHSVEQGCYQEIAAEPAQPICGMEEAGHVHSEECYSEESVLTCTEPEGDGHQHGESCYTMETTLICDLPEADGHTHTAECYPAEDAEATPELELVCELPEHTHTEDCYADDAAQHAQVEEVAALIDALPSAEEVEARLAELLAADDAEAYDAYCAELARQVEQANAAYEALTDEQKAQLNIDKLTALFVYLPAKEGTFTLTAPATKSGITVTISGETASLPFPVEELTLTAVEVEDENANALRDEALESEELTAAENYMLDIRLMHGDEEVQPTGPITVTFAGLPLDGGADVALVDDVNDNADTDAEPVAYQAKEMAAQAVVANAADDTDMSDETTDDTADDAGESYVTGPKVYQIDEGTQQATEVDVAVNDENNVVLETDQLTNLYSVSLLAANGNVTTAAALKTACEAGGTVVLGKDISISTTITIDSGKNTTLDLNGYKITCLDTGKRMLFDVKNEATLTLKDSQAASISETVSSVTTSAGRVASYSNNKLTYYVTTSRENNATNHTTVENTTKHVVTLGGGKAGAIVGSSVLEKVAFGVRGTLNIEGGYICGFVYGSNLHGPIRVYRHSAIKISGGVIAANKCETGGAIFLDQDSTLTMTGGVISGNTASIRGGGVYTSSGTFTMTGGYITNNRQINEGSTDAGGGGVYLSYGNKFVMSNGYITGNKAAKVGGGISTFHTSEKTVDSAKQAKITITGGFICGNVSTNTFGGGINCDTFNECTIGGADTPVYISNNRGEGMEGLGGGGIHAGHGSRLTLYNALITKNTAGALGGGYSCCETSSTFLYLSNGVAIFDNSDGGKISSTSSLLRGDCDKDSYIYAGLSNNPVPYPIKDTTDHSDVFICGHIKITSKLLGGGDPQWRGSRDGVQMNLTKGDIVAAKEALGMKSYASDADKALARAAANVYITGNYSGRHGGGVLSNGIVYFGEKPKDYTFPTAINLIGKKALLREDGTVSESVPEGAYQFALTDTNGTVISTATAASDGTIIFPSLSLSEEGTYTYLVKETTKSTVTMRTDATIYTITVIVKAKTEILHDTDTGLTMGTGIYYYPTEVTVVNNTTGKVTFQTKELHDENTVILRSTASGGAAFTNQLKEGEYTLDITKQDAATGKGIGVATFEMQTYVMDPRAADKGGTGKEMYISMFCVKVKDGVYRYAGYSWKSGMPSDIVQKFATDTNGKLQIVGLPAGKYQMREIGAPEGYQIAERWGKWNDILLNATEVPSGTKTITVADPPATYTFQFYKVSAADKTTPVPDAKYQLLDSKGVALKFTKKSGSKYAYSTSGTVTTLITDATGAFQLLELPKGDYRLHEIEAPAGFGLAKDHSFTLSLETTGKQQLFTYTQEEPLAQYELPETGGGGAKPYVITGAALLAGAACLMVCRDKRRKAGGRTS